MRCGRYTFTLCQLVYQVCYQVVDSNGRKEEEKEMSFCTQAF